MQRRSVSQDFKSLARLGPPVGWMMDVISVTTLLWGAACMLPDLHCAVN